MNKVFMHWRAVADFEVQQEVMKDRNPPEPTLASSVFMPSLTKCFFLMIYFNNFKTLF